MKAAFILALMILASTTKLHATENRSCAAGIEGAAYVHIHGRLGVYNGGYPNLRLWQVGTHHLFGIYSDPTDLKCQRGSACNEDEDTKMPSNVGAMLKLPNPYFQFVIYADFQLRLLEPSKEGHMQAACIVSADHLIRAQLTK
jgi:hypothetical protein